MSGMGISITVSRGGLVRLPPESSLGRGMIGVTKTPLSHLVVVVPGIGGSVLQRPDGASLWDEHRRRLVGAMTRPGRLGLDEFPELIPVDLLPDITVVGPCVVPGYDRLVRKIVNHFRDVRVDTARPGQAPDLRANVLLFPYDFRYSIEHAAEKLGGEIAARLSGEHGTARQRRVIIVAHSMGGLVARHWLGPGGGAQYCRALITLGTPHRGAPRALDVLANGLPVGPRRLKRLTAVLRGWPSMYELLPRYRALAHADGTAPLYPHQWDADPSFARQAKAAFAVHQDIEAAWVDLAELAKAPTVTPVFSRGHGTLQQALLTLKGVSVTKAAASWLPNRGWHGDGTVPAISAIPIEIEDDVNARRAVTDRHMALSSTSAVIDLLGEYEGESLRSVRGNAPEQPWLGLDLDDITPVGQAVPFGVTLHGIEPDEGTRIHFRHKPLGKLTAGSMPWQEARRDADGRAWFAELAPLPAGNYSVEIAASGVPSVGRLTAGDVLGSIDAEDPQVDE